MNGSDTIDDFLRDLLLQDYPLHIIKRREITFRRFLKTHGELNVENITDFIEANNFFRKETYTLLKIDWLSLIHFIEPNGDLFYEIDKSIVGF